MEPFTLDMRKQPRSTVENSFAYIEGQTFPIHDLSHGGFAVSGKLENEDPDKVYTIKFVLKSTNRQMETQCTIMKMWNHDDMSGFEFYKPDKQQLVDISNFLQALDATQH